MIFLTGVGFRHLLAAVERHVDRQRYLDTPGRHRHHLPRPKPVAAMAEVGLKPTHRVPEPNTWRELLATIDGGIPVANQNVGLQEYGITNPSLIAGLEARGAQVVNVRVYQWELPRRHAGRWKRTSGRSAAGERDVRAVHRAHQVVEPAAHGRAAWPGAADCARRLQRTVGRLDRPDDQRDAREITSCRSTWSRNIPRWARWWRPRPRSRRRSSRASGRSPSSVIARPEAIRRSIRRRPGTTARS